MKRILSILFFCVAFSCLPAQAQVKVGVKGGVNVSQLKLNEGLFEGSNRAGFFVGPTLELDLPLNVFTVDFAILYDNYMVSMRQGDRSLSETLQYIDVPVNVSMSFGVESLVKFYISTGPQLSFNCAKIHILEGNYSLDNTMLSWNLGVGVRLFKNYHVSYTYNVGIGYTAELTNRYSATSDMSERLYNPTHKIGLTYFF